MKKDPLYVCRGCCHPARATGAMNDFGDKEGACLDEPFQTGLGESLAGFSA